MALVKTQNVKGRNNDGPDWDILWTLAAPLRPIPPPPPTPPECYELCYLMQVIESIWLSLTQKYFQFILKQRQIQSTTKLSEICKSYKSTNLKSVIYIHYIYYMHLVSIMSSKMSTCNVKPDCVNFFFHTSSTTLLNNPRNFFLNCFVFKWRRSDNEM